MLPVDTLSCNNGFVYCMPVTKHDDFLYLHVDSHFYFYICQLGSRITSGSSTPGINNKAAQKKPSIGQKKPLEALGSSPPPSRWNQLALYLLSHLFLDLGFGLSVL